MAEASNIQAAMGLVLDPEHLKLEFQSLYDGIGKATEVCMSNPERYGYELWANLYQRHAYLPALDQTIDRLPPQAFGRSSPSAHLTALMKEWATYKAVNLFRAYFMFKTMALMCGWKPAQVNSYLVVGLRMEETMLGGPIMADEAPDFSALDQSGLNARERGVVEYMANNPAH